MLGLFMFRDSFANIVMITFTSLILIEVLNVYTQVSADFCILIISIDTCVYFQNDANANCINSNLLYFNNPVARVL